MKQFLLFLTFNFMSFSALAQIQSNAKVEAVISAKVIAFKQALIDADSEKLKELTSRDLSYGHSNGVLQDQKVFIEKLVSGESDFVTIDFQDQTIQISGNIAIVRHNLVAHTKDSGVEKDIKIGVMLVWHEKNNKWLLVARQAFKLPTP